MKFFLIFFLRGRRLFEKRKTGLELKTKKGRKTIVRYNLRNIRILGYVFLKICHFFGFSALYIETCFLVSLLLPAPRDVRGVFYASVAERPNAAMGGTVGGAACRVPSVRVLPEAPFF